jgi:Ca2+-binding EF-hand superfamily protein
MAKDISNYLATGLLGLALGVGATAALAASPAPAGAPAAGDASASMTPQGMPFAPTIEQVFEMLDGDHDGVVTLAEALKGIGQHFDMVDQNKDGTLDTAEFESWFGRANPEAARFFLSLYDIDGDGKVTRAEFENPVKKRFALFDRNDDGKVTPDELRFARMLMSGGPTSLLVPPMAPTVPEAPAPKMPLRGAAQPAPQYPAGPAPQPYPQQPMPQVMQQQMPPVMQQQMPQSLGPAPGVYGPGGQSWNPAARPMFQGGNNPMYMPQGPMR